VIRKKKLKEISIKLKKQYYSLRKYLEMKNQNVKARLRKLFNVSLHLKRI